MYVATTFPPTSTPVFPNMTTSQLALARCRVNSQHQTITSRYPRSCCQKTSYVKSSEAHPIPEHPRLAALSVELPLWEMPPGYVTKSSGEGIYLLPSRRGCVRERLWRFPMEELAFPVKLTSSYLKRWDKKYGHYKVLDILQTAYRTDATREAFVEM